MIKRRRAQVPVVHRPAETPATVKAETAASTHAAGTRVLWRGVVVVAGAVWAVIRWGWDMISGLAGSILWAAVSIGVTLAAWHWLSR
ncbi:MAG: hypothetical protein KGZ75_07840 [Syntrophomonadaceae bacterium]|nr:hypothetical protein [Syntrophomonadaceae bacterium]